MCTFFFFFFFRNVESKKGKTTHIVNSWNLNLFCNPLQMKHKQKFSLWNKLHLGEFNHTPCKHFAKLILTQYSSSVWPKVERLLVWKGRKCQLDTPWLQRLFSKLVKTRLAPKTCGRFKFRSANKKLQTVKHNCWMKIEVPVTIWVKEGKKF